MKISMVADNYFPTLGGGIDIHVCELSRKLRKLGYEPIIVAPLRDPRVHGGRLINEQNEIPVLRLDIAYDKKIRELCEFLKSPEINVIHSHGGLSLSLAGLVAANILDKPSVITLHSAHHVFPSNYSRKRLTRQTIKDLNSVYRIIEKADFISVPTMYAKEKALRNLHISPERVVVIPNWVDLKLFNPSEYRSLSKKFKSQNPQKIVLYVGNFCEEKGVFFLLHAMSIVGSQIAGVRLFIVGTLPKQSLMQSLLKLFDLEGRITLVGPVKHTRIPWFYSIADVVVLPSFLESFGIVLLEAMAMGKPIITTKIKGVMELVADKREGILVNPGDSKELASAIISILSNSDVSAKIGRKGLEKAQQYSIDSVINQVLTLYKLCLDV